MVAIGDIVHAPLFLALGDRWVVAEARAAMLGPDRDLRLLCGGGAGGGWVSTWALETLVEVVSSPVYAPGDLVTANGRRAEVVGPAPAQHEGELRVRVVWRDCVETIKDGLRIRHGDRFADFPTWQLTLEGRLHG